MIDTEKYCIRFTVFCIGLFSLGGQALLFRKFLSVFDGSELSTGLFFFSWLIWMSFGALIAYVKFISKRTVKVYEFMPILFVKAFVIQNLLLMNARWLTNTPEFEAIDLHNVVISLFFFNAPVSIVTGFLFVNGSKWIKKLSVPVAKFYTIEALGSFAGALLVTLLLFCGVDDNTVFMFLASILIYSVFLHATKRNCGGKLRRMFYAFTGISATGFAVVAILGEGLKLSEYESKKEWKRILPHGKFKGVFYTPQAKYLYGNYKDSFIITRWGGVCDTLPAKNKAVETVAINLSQCPSAQKIIVVGDGGLTISQKLAQQPQVKKVVWLDPDPAYPNAMLKLVPGKYNSGMEKVEMPETDIRQFLENDTDKYDLIIVNVSEPSSLVMNRYFSINFFKLVKQSLTSKGVISLGFPGGENFVGKELAYMGASLFASMSKVFPRIVLKPGESSRFFASAKGGVTSNIDELEKRLKNLEIAKEFPTDGLYTLFDPFRMDFQMDKYKKVAAASKSSLVNSDFSPIMFFYMLLFAAKKLGGISLSMQRLSPWTIVFWMSGIIGFFLIVRMVRVLLKKSHTHVSRPDIMFFVFTSSIVAMGLNLLLIFIFQVEFGSIYLYFGTVNALFMLGLYAGAGAARLIKSKTASYGYHGFFLLSMIMMIFTLILFLIQYDSVPVYMYTALFFGTGFVSGTWLPFASYILKHRKISDTKSALLLEISDTCGGAVGGIVVTWILLPQLGVYTTLNIAIVLLGMMAFWAIILRKEIVDKKAVTAIVFIALGLTTLFAQGKNSSNLSKYFNGKHITTEKVAVKNSTIYHILKYPSGKIAGYIYSTKDFSPSIKGYNGPIVMKVLVDSSGKLLNFKITSSRESRAFQRRVIRRKKELTGKNIFKSKTGFKGDAVTGATYTANAITRTLNISGQNFKVMLDKNKVQTKEIKNASPPPGGAEDVNVKKYKSLIKQGKLSDKNAMFYKRINK